MDRHLLAFFATVFTIAGLTIGVLYFLEGKSLLRSIFYAGLAFLIGGAVIGIIAFWFWVFKV